MFDVDKLEKQLQKNLEVIELIGIKAKNLYKNHLISEKELSDIISNLKAIVKKIELILSLIKNIKFKKELIT